MNEIIEIRLKNIKTDNKFESALNDIFKKIIEKAREIKIWDESLESIIITDNFNEEIYKQAEKWGVKTEISFEKEYAVISKLLFNHNLDSPKHILFIQYISLFIENYSLSEIVFSQLISIKARKIIPRHILDIQFKTQPSTLNTFITVASIEWIKSYYTKITLESVLGIHRETMNHNSFLTAFKRSLKRNLFEYNSDKLTPDDRINELWHNYYKSINNLFLRILENETDNETYLINQKEGSKELIYKVSNEVKHLYNSVINGKNYDINCLKQKVVDFSNYYGVHLENETDKSFGIRLSQNPKSYFKELIDTEPRIVSFIDILGFSDYVNRYESDITSTFLQDIQDSFTLAKEHLLDNRNIYNRIAIEHLEYKTFSDNICISIPYFDNENDFLSNFNILSIYIRGLQMIMMAKGFFMRGGVSIGSYYADNNIILSKGLINAYNLESTKAIYPRIMVDKEIIEKILSYNESQIKYYGLQKAIIFDWENNAFLNPTSLLDYSLNPINTLINETLEDSQDYYSELLKNMTKATTEMMSLLFKKISEGEKETLEHIKKLINYNMTEYEENERIYSKYLWLKELFKWLQNDGNEKLKFYYLEDFFDNKN